MNHTEFAVSRFENRNGVTSWRVSGLLHGLRVRKNFRTREEAFTEKAALELKVLQIAAGQRPIVTNLTQDQAREAEAVFRQLAGKAHPLSFYVDFALANYREPENQKSLAGAIKEYVASKVGEQWDYRVPPLRFAELELGETIILRDGEVWRARWHKHQPESATENDVNSLLQWQDVLLSILNPVFP